jgi:hypothetical protein
VKIMLALAACLVLALSTAAYGQLVKCVSKGGKVEYANECPPGTTEQKTRIRSSTGADAPASAPPEQKTLIERDAESRKRASEQQEAQQKDAEKSANADTKSANCELAKSFLKDLESGLRMTRTDPQTMERAYLDDSEREAEMVKARARIAQSCN